MLDSLTSLLFLGQAAAPAASAEAAAPQFLVTALNWVYANWMLILLVLVIAFIALIVLFIVGRIIYRKMHLWRVSRDLEGDLLLRKQLAKMAEGGEAGKEAEKELLRARLSDLNKRFETGLSVFRAHGKSLNSLPWYLLLGEPGAGKSELIRKSGLPFPQGIVDLSQGQAGTSAFDWWISNNAVIIDVAGKLFLNRWGESSDIEWTHFVKLLRRRRSMPLNGLLLTIPSDSLLADNEALLQKKAKIISDELRALQRILGLRLPIYVVVTKIDQAPGMREFCEHISGDQAKQMLGWSNSSPQGAFSDEIFSKGFTGLVEQLRSLRPSLLLGKHLWDGGQSSARCEKAASLHSFPESVASMHEPLRIYLSNIFAASQWSGDSLLMLRGVYLTSSTDKGAVLDEKAATALKKPIDDAIIRRAPIEGRTLFVNELFQQKVFPERNLAGYCSWVRMRLARPYLIASAFCIVAAAFILFGAFANKDILKELVNRNLVEWSNTSKLLKEGKLMDSPVISVDMEGEAIPVFFRLVSGYPSYTRGNFLRRMVSISNEDLPLPFNYFLASSFFGDFHDSLFFKARQDLYQLVFSEMFFLPMVNSARDKFLRQEDVDWSDKATDALSTLILMEEAYSRKVSNGKASSVGDFKLKSLTDFVFPESLYFDTASSDTHLGWRFNLGNPDSLTQHMLRAGSSYSRSAISVGVDRFCMKWRNGAVHDDATYHDVASMLDLMEEFIKCESSLFDISAQLKKASPDSMKSADAIDLRDKWLELESRMAKCAASLDNVDEPLASSSRLKIIEIASKASDDYLRLMNKDFETVAKRIDRCIPFDSTGFFKGLSEKLAVARLEVADKIHADITRRTTRLDANLQIMWGVQEAQAAVKDYQVRMALYESVALASLPKQPISNILDLNAKLKSSEDNIKAAEKALASSSGAPAQATAAATPGQQQTVQKQNDYLHKANTAASNILELTKRVNSHVLLSSTVRVCPSSDSEYLALIRGKAETLKPVKALPLALSSIGSNFVFDPSFHPDAVQILTSEMAKLKTMVEASKLEKYAALDPELSQRYGRVMLGLNDYMDLYFDYWSVKLDELSSVRKFDSWADFLSQARNLKAYEVNSSLLSIYNSGLSALLAPSLEKGTPLELKFKARESWYLSRIQLISDIFTYACSTTLAGWAILPDDANEAFAAINALTPEQVQTQLLGSYSGDPKSRVDWWSQFIENGTIGMKAELGRFVQKNVKLWSNSLMCFPICNTPNRNAILPPSEMADACDKLDSFLKMADLSAPAKAPGKPGDPALIPSSTQLLPNMKMLGFLKSDVVLDTPDKRLWFKKVRDIVSVLNDQDKPLYWSLTVPGASAQAKIPQFAQGLNMTPGFYRYRYMEIYSQGARLGKRVPTVMSDGKPKPFTEISDLASRDDLTIFFFGDANATTPLATLSFNGAWGAMNLFVRDSAAFDDEAKCYLVPVQITDGDGYRCFYWIGMSFDRPVPPPSYWPTIADWIDYSPISESHLQPAELNKILYDSLRSQAGAGDTHAANAKLAETLDKAAPYGARPAFSIYIPSSRDQERKPGAATPSGIRFMPLPSNVPDSGAAMARYFEVYVDGKLAGERMKTLRDDGAEQRGTGLALPLLSGDLEFRFYSFSNSQLPIKTVQLKGPDALMGLLRSRHRVKNPRDYTFMAPLLLEESKGENYYFWLGLELVYDYMPPAKAVKKPAAEAKADDSKATPQ